jgi:hypothetical protein
MPTTIVPGWWLVVATGLTAMFSPTATPDAALDAATRSPCVVLVALGIHLSAARECADAA